MIAPWENSANLTKVVKALAWLTAHLPMDVCGSGYLERQHARPDTSVSLGRQAVAQPDIIVPILLHGSRKFSVYLQERTPPASLFRRASEPTVKFAPALLGAPSRWQFSQELSKQQQLEEMFSSALKH
jgi:hypothetical protein